MAWHYNHYDSMYQIFIGTVAAAVIVTAAIGLVFYLFQAIGLYQMSKRRGYRHAGLAFVPVVGGYVLGGVADNINACYGKKSSWRIWTVVLQALNLVGGAVLLVVFFQRLPALFYSNYESPYFIFSFFMPILTTSLFVSLLSIGYMVVFYIVLYRIFQDYSTNAVLFVVLSILFGISPFFLFALRAKPSASIAYRSQFYSPGAGGCPPPQTPPPPNPPQNQPPQNPQGPAV